MALSTSYASVVSRGNALTLLPSSSSLPVDRTNKSPGGEHDDTNSNGSSNDDSGGDMRPTLLLGPFPSGPAAAQRRPRPRSNMNSRDSSPPLRPASQQQEDPPAEEFVVRGVVAAPPYSSHHYQQPRGHRSFGTGSRSSNRHHHHNNGNSNNNRRDGGRYHHSYRPPLIRNVLRDMGCLESPDRDRAREEALSYVEDKLREWVQHVTCNAKSGRSGRPKRDQSTSSRGSGHGNVKGNEATVDANAGVDKERQLEQQGGHKDVDDVEVDDPLVALIPFGSYRLGVHRPNSDLDCLVLTSAADVARSDFYSSWVEMLRNDPNVSHVHPIPNAFTPVLKFQYRTSLVDVNGTPESLQLDLLFAKVTRSDKLSDYCQRRRQVRLQQQLQQQVTVGASSTSTSMIPPSLMPTEYYWIDNRDLPGQDAAGVRSLNGCRVTQIILQLIAGGISGLNNNNGRSSAPGYDGHVSRLRTQRYQEMLCVVKQWAIQAGIYGNALGFLGGVNWAILVAWVCLTSPEFSDPQRLRNDGVISHLIRKFFVVFGQWRWPNPVMLTPVDLVPPRELASSSTSMQGLNELQPWNPAVVKRDAFHIMPILTPAWPAMNSAYNVGIPHLRRMQDEFGRARHRIASVPTSGVLPALFDLDNFVSHHRHYLVITMTTDRSEPADVHKQWCQFLESKLRLLVINLETTEIHPWPYSKFFHDHDDDDQYRTYFCLALRFAPHVSNVNLQHLTSDWLQRINGWPGRTPSVDLKLEHTIDVKLPPCVLEEVARSSRYPGSHPPPGSRGHHHGDASSSGGSGGGAPSISATGSADWDSDDNGSRASDKSFASVASSFSSEVCQQTKRYRGDDGGNPVEEENLQN